MRRSGSTTFLRTPHGRFLGVQLAPNFCAEHECGVRPLMESLGIPPRDVQSAEQAAMGLDFYRQRALADPTRILFDAGDADSDLAPTILGLSARRMDCSIPQALRAAELEHRARAGTQSAWFQSGFLIVTTEPAHRGWLAELHRALLTGDALVTSHGYGALAGGGLTVAVHSRVDVATREATRAGMADTVALHETAAATGIEARVRAAKLGFFALSPDWETPGMESRRPSAHRVRFWLNPRDQRAFNAGWFSVEQLDEWIAGTGPVIREAKRAS